MYVRVGEDCFERAKEFVPERWNERPEMVRQKQAFAPFGMGEWRPLPFQIKTCPLKTYASAFPLLSSSPIVSRSLLDTTDIIPTGRAACVGQGLATTQLRLVLASLVKRFRISFLPGEDGREVLRDMRDQLTAQPGRLRVMFEPRG